MLASLFAEAVSPRGLARQVTIHRDEWGVPHVYAAGAEDAWAAAGTAKMPNARAARKTCFIGDSSSSALRARLPARHGCSMNKAAAAAGQPRRRSTSR